MEGIEKSLDLLCNIRELSTIMDIKNHITREKDKIDYKNIDEFQYCALKSRFETLEELESILNEKVKTLSKQVPV